MNRTVLAVMLAAASTLFAGCAVQTEGDNDGPVTESEDALSTKGLQGTWIADTGPIYRIEFTATPAETLGGFLKGKSFNADVDNGIRCITTPCDSSDGVGGVYKVSGNTVTLASYDKPSLVFSRYLGDYKATLSGSKLTLKKTDGTVAGTFHKEAKAVTCGTNKCGAGTYCCNPVMSICTPLGMMCIM